MHANTRIETTAPSAPWTPPRHPHTAFMGLMALALTLFIGWSFVHPPGTPALSAHATHASGAPVAKG